MLFCDLMRTREHYIYFIMARCAFKLIVSMQKQHMCTHLINYAGCFQLLKLSPLQHLYLMYNRRMLSNTAINRQRYQMAHKS